MDLTEKYPEIKEYEEDIQKKIMEELDIMDAYTQKLIDRVEDMSLVHEDLVVIQKLDVRAMKSFLHFVEASRFDQIRTSYYGKVLKVSDVNSGDEVKQQKKMLIDRGDIVTFNPDSAYSLNVIVPEEHPEIWVLSVENILLVDRGFDAVGAKIKSIAANVLIERSRREQANQKLQVINNNIRG